MTWHDQAIAHAQQEAPREACGLLVVVNGRMRYQPCRNLSPEPEITFNLAPADFARAADHGTVVGVVHSHPEGDATPSPDDLDNCSISGLPWYIVTPDGDYRRVVVSGQQEPLAGRPWIWGDTDCWALVREWYWRHGVLLPDWPRPSQQVFEADPWFDRLAEQAGFYEVEEPAWGDMLMMRLSGGMMTDHVGVALGNRRVIHHLQHRLSSCDRMAPFVACGYRVMRHENSSALRPPCGLSGSL